MEQNRVPLVSICTLVYNHEPYLRECFDGILMQKTNFAFEVLVHDDASTDNSAAIIREYTAKYPNIFKPIYQTENQYSKGIKVNATYQYPRAKGKYIAICEGDDYWIDPLKLQKQVDILEQNSDIGLVYTQVEAFDSNGAVGQFAFEVKDAKALLFVNGIANLTTCYRRDLLTAYFNDVSPENKNWLMGDYPMWFYFLYNSKAYFLSDTTARYRIRQNSASHSTDINKVVEFEKSALNVRTYFIDKFWNNDEKLLRKVYALATKYIFQLYLVNNKDREAFEIFFNNFKYLYNKQKAIGIILWLLPFVKKNAKIRWSTYIRIF